MTRCAETGRVPPASGVMVSAVALPAGSRGPIGPISYTENYPITDVTHNNS